MEGTIGFYIKNRMSTLGVQRYSFSVMPVTVKLAESVTRINAHNEYWYLFDVNQTEDDFTITANNNIITKEEFVVDGVPFITYEFTGDIKINNAEARADQTFLFYRIIPS